MQPTNTFRLFLMLFLDQSTTKKFLMGVWIGLAFSISVILSTIGIMDGFEHTLRKGLKRATGDVSMQSRYGFFQINDFVKNGLEESNIKKFSALVQTESFLIFNDESRGVQVKAIDESYGDVVGLKLDLPPGSVAIGSEIARINQVGIGDEIVLAFGKGGSEFRNMPALKRFTVTEIVTHGVYQKDARIIYARLDEVQAMQGLGQRINTIAFNIEKTKQSSDNELKNIENKLTDLRMRFEPDFYFRPYWREFSAIIEAAQTEKFMIGLILQVIVVVAIFNVLGFIYFINEKKAKELFLFKALGLSRRRMNNLWLKLVVGIWLSSCLLSIVLVQIFRFLLLKISLFKLPAEVYLMPRIDLYISWRDYALVFALALVWMLLITYYLLRKLKNKSLLEGLRQEFV